MSSRIRIKMGQVEIEYEGTDEFLKGELLDLVKAVADLYQEGGGALTRESNGNEEGANRGVGTAGKLKATTNQIATTLGISKGPDLIFAAGVKLHFVNGQETFTRQQLLSEAKTATKYYKESNHSRNLSNILQSLVSGGRFNEPGSNTYALTDDALSSAESKLA